MCCKGAENTHNENESLAIVTLNLIFLINLATSLLMTGVIWVIQLVHYPSFHYVTEDKFQTFHQFHNRNISLIVVPVMIIELVTSGALWWHHGSQSLHGNGFFLVILIWFSTAVFSVPAHSRLSSGKTKNRIDYLVRTNWIRTILWSVKSILSVLLI